MIAANVPFIVRKASDNSIVFSGETSLAGTSNVSLSPGNYLLEIGEYVGYLVDLITKQQSGGAIVEYPDPVDPIPFTIAEDAVTSSVISLISNAD